MKHDYVVRGSGRQRARWFAGFDKLPCTRVAPKTDSAALPNFGQLNEIPFRGRFVLAAFAVR